MASERVQRRVDRLLDDADAAAEALDQLEAAGAVFAEHGLTYSLDQVLAKKEILKT